jgi:hypothetical protein
MDEPPDAPLEDFWTRFDEQGTNMETWRPRHQPVYKMNYAIKVREASSKQDN